MAKTLPPKGASRIWYDDLVRLAKKEHSGKTLSVGEERRRESDYKRLKKAGYNIAEVNSYIVSRLGDRSGSTSFGLGDIKVANPLDTAKMLVDKAHLDFLSKIGDPHTWLRVAFIILGGLFFLIGLGMLLKELGQGKIASKLPIAKAVGA